MHLLIVFEVAFKCCNPQLCPMIDHLDRGNCLLAVVVVIGRQLDLL